MTAPLHNDRLLRALRRQPVDATPVWLMRQAGRYLPEYRATRAQAGSFMQLCQNSELACTVTLQPLARFPLDAAILFSDILTVPDAMGLGLTFSDGEGPQFARPLRSMADIKCLAQPDPEQELRYVMDALRTIRRELGGRVPLIGFAGSPWTLATYMVEGGASKDYARIKGMLYQQPQALHRLLALLAATLIDYLNAQAAAGAQALMLFDTWGGLLTPSAYREFSLHYMAQIIAGLQREVDGQYLPVILFTKGGGAWLEDMAASGCDALGVDWHTDLGAARQRVGARVALQGNLDPAALYAPATRLRELVAETLGAFGSAPGHIFNLGHGVQPGVDPEQVRILVDAVHELSQPYHAKCADGG